MSLSVLPVGLDTLGRSCKIRYEHSGAGEWLAEEQVGLQKRQGQPQVSKQSQKKCEVYN